MEPAFPICPQCAKASPSHRKFCCHPPCEPMASPRQGAAGTPGKAALPRRQFTSLHGQSFLLRTLCRSGTRKGRFLPGARQCRGPVHLNGLFMASKRNTSAAVFHVRWKPTWHPTAGGLLGRDAPRRWPGPLPAVARLFLASKGVFWAPLTRARWTQQCPALRARVRGDTGTGLFFPAPECFSSLAVCEVLPHS